MSDAGLRGGGAKQLDAGLNLAAVISAAPVALILAGCLILAIDLSLDFLGQSRPGFGVKQILMAGAGALSVCAGVAALIVSDRLSAREALKFGVLTAQVGLIAFALNIYDIENIAYSQYLTVLIFCGFIANHFLPASWRMAFFLALSLAAVFGVLHLQNGLIVIGVGAALIGVCHIKAPMIVRIVILIGAMAALGAVRGGLAPANWSEAALPILASMFMFRLSIYLYDIANGKGPKSWPQRFAYFFMLPNAVFPFFPVVDFTSFGRTYYNEDALKIYERGASWMLRGLAHLLLYRIVSYYLVIDPAAVSGPLDFFYYVTTNFFLYLKVSGLFHLIIGGMLLFGFNLPETHTRFYFSNSFIDFWRRINIFWKDYMQKMVFTPSFVRLKRWGVGQNAAILASMLAVFFVTWVLHAYQWFWIRGSVHLSATDAFFWGFLAVMLVVQTSYEMRLAAQPKKPAGRRTPLGHKAMLVLRTSATMVTIFVLWSLWTSATFDEWFELLHAAGAPRLGAGAAISDYLVALAIAAFALFVLGLTLGVTFGIGPHASEAPRRPLAKRKEQPFYAPAAARLAFAGALCALQFPVLTAPFSSGLQQFALDIGTSKLNARDAAALERGYYEGLTDVNRFNTELWQLYSKRPTGWVDIRVTEAARDTGDYLQYELKPSTSIIYKGAPFQTNRWGMRDRHYAKEKPEGAFRFALIGDSRAMGYGVADPDVFENILEERMNAELKSAKFNRFEILNFGVADYKPVQRLMVIERKALEFSPDAVIYFGHFDDFELRHLAEAVENGIDLPYPELSEIVARSGATANMSKEEIRRRIYAHEDEVVQFVFRRMAAIEKEKGVPIIWVYLPSVKVYTAEEKAACERLIAMAKQAGFTTIDLFGMFDGEDMSKLWVAEWDYHPNALGNRKIADRLFDEFLASPVVAGLMEINPPTTDQATSQ